MNNKTNYGEKFTTRLSEIGKSAYWLSKELKIPYSSVTNYLNGGTIPHDRFVKMCNILNVTL